MILYGYITAFSYAIFCIFVAFCLNKLGLDKKYTRKIVHISVGIEWFILYHFMGESYHFLIVCLACLLLLFVEFRVHIVPALSSEGDNAPGTVYYGLAMSVMAALSLLVQDMLMSFGIGVIATSLGDGMAGIVGQLVKRRNPKIYGSKTLLGTISIFVFSFIGILLFKHIYELPIVIWQAIAVSAFAAALELISVRGFDNITVTIGAALLSYSLMYLENTTDYLVPILLTPIVIATVLSKKVLTKLGVVFAIALDVVVSVAFGNAGFLVLLTFLVLSVASDKAKAFWKSDHMDKPEIRSGRQVLANGIVPAVCALLFIFTKNSVFTLMYIAAVAEAFSDTVASGIGVFAKNTYDPFRLKRCEQGISGGMSLVGTASSLFAALLISALSALLGMTDIITALVIAAFAFLGMIFDSLLGSLLQVKYKCSVCGKVTESKVHCGAASTKYRGISFINNDAVNLIANFFAALLALAIY